MRANAFTRRRTLLTAAAAFTSACATASPAEDDAPLTLPEMVLHDPWIVADRTTRTYRLYTRNEASMTGANVIGTMMYQSRDLAHWTRPRVVFQMPAGIWANDGGWAPEVHLWAGRWYLLTTLHNESIKLAPTHPPRAPYRRGTVLGVSNTLDGPFTLINGGEPIAPATLMTLDGTLYMDRAGRPWCVYAHEWLQDSIGSIEAIPLNAVLRADGPPRLLFHANEAPWVVGQTPYGPDDVVYVTDGPELFRTRTDTLLMLWSSYGERGYVQGIARSLTGDIEGPWEQLDPLVRDDSGHGMLFHTFDGKLMLILHRPFNHERARGKLYEMRDTGDGLEIVRQRTDLDGDPPA